MTDGCCYACACEQSRATGQREDIPPVRLHTGSSSSSYPTILRSSMASPTAMDVDDEGSTGHHSVDMKDGKVGDLMVSAVWQDWIVLI